MPEDTKTCCLLLCCWEIVSHFVSHTMVCNWPSAALSARRCTRMNHPSLNSENFYLYAESCLTHGARMPYTYTAELLFHQSPMLHSYYMVTGQWQCSHLCKLPTVDQLCSHWSLCSRQFTTVTTPSLSSHRVGDWWNKSFVVGVGSRTWNKLCIHRITCF